MNCNTNCELGSTAVLDLMFIVSYWEKISAAGPTSGRKTGGEDLGVGITSNKMKDEKEKELWK